MALKFELVTPARLERSRDVYMVTVPGSEGDFSVLEGHAPFMATLRNGSLTIYTSAGAAPATIDVAGGFAEVHQAGLTVLAEPVAGWESGTPGRMQGAAGTFFDRALPATAGESPIWRKVGGKNR